VRLADVALYATKAQGRDGWSFQADLEAAVAAAAGQCPDGPQPAASGRDATDERQAAALLKTAS